MLRIGAGAGYSGDRIEPAADLAEHGELDYLVFECLAERTIALAQRARLADPNAGYDPLLDARWRAVLPACARQGVRVITNMGAANPLAAAERTLQLLAELGLGGLRVAAVHGDDVLAQVQAGDYRCLESGLPLRELGQPIVSANAYLGIEPICAALDQGAQIVVTGRTGDPALFLAPLVHEFGWRLDDWDRLGQGTVVGHLLECAGQVCGGYFADPGFSDVPDLARLGFPIGEVSADGELIVGKLRSAGGRVSAATCKEQLLYEIHDPAHYLQPDVVADFSQVAIDEVGPDRVRVRGGRGQPRPATLKVSVGLLDGWIGEGQISYAGAGAAARARLAAAVVAERLRLCKIATLETRFDLIGIDSMRGADSRRASAEPAEVRLRVVARTEREAEAIRVANEVESLFTNGPAGGGGAVKSVRQVVAVQSVLMPRELVVAKVQMMEPR